MDTKSKSIKYSPGAQTAAFIIVWLCAVSAFACMLYLGNNYSVVSSESYFDSYKFKNNFGFMAYDVVQLNVELGSEAKIEASGETEEEIQENLRRYHAIKNRLSSTVNFTYYLENAQTGEKFTNLTGDALTLIKKQPTMVFYDQWTYYGDSQYPVGGSIMQTLTNTPYKLYAAVVEPLKPGDVFYTDYHSYAGIKSLSDQVIILLIASVVLTVLAFLYLAAVTGRREQGKAIALSFVDKMYADVYIALVFIAALISVLMAARLAYDLSNKVNFILITVIFALDVLIGLTFVLSMIRQIKSKQLIKNTLIYKTLYLCFSGRAFKTWILALLPAYGLVNGILFWSGAATHQVFLVTVFLVMPFNIAVIYLAARSLMSLAQIMRAVKEISTGNIDYALDKSDISVAFAGFAGDIQSIQGGLKKAVAEAVKGERMKTDLIANVSHDLKTPLTSVINYVDLLKQEHLDNAKAREYINILEEKSARLKQLIEDLIEAGKASSGNLTVNTEKIDLHELIRQACGEYEEKLKEADLDLHVHTADEKTFIAADGKHMWRIVENLLSNVVKYSLPHSRVYVNVAQNAHCGLLTIKNISATPLDISPEQITERFVRGDASRTTEGSGLGLSIAQSLTVIQGGGFKIEIDGDLFKVTLEMPLWV